MTETPSSSLEMLSDSYSFAIAVVLSAVPPEHDLADGDMADFFYLFDRQEGLGVCGEANAVASVAPFAGSDAKALRLVCTNYRTNNLKLGPKWAELYNVRADLER